MEWSHNAVVVAEEEEEEGKAVGRDEKESPPIHGDILELILSHVPLIDLVLASHVSKSWNRASLLLHSNKPKPIWLFLHAQSSRPPYTITSHAYDPRAAAWFLINRPSLSSSALIRSSHSNLLYMLSPWKLSFSTHPLHLTWHHAPAPLVWRTDPIVALSGRRLLVAGGSCGFEDDLLQVEVYDMDSREWTSSESMPSVFKDSAASAWISVAAVNNLNILFVHDKCSGITYTFDPETLDWCGPLDLRPDPRIYYSVIGSTDWGIVMVGLVGETEDLEGVKIWGVKTESNECQVMGEMPLVLVEEMRSEVCEVSSVGVCTGGNVVYIYNPMEIGKVFVCELLASGGCEWRSVRNVVVADDDGIRMGRVVFSCSDVGIPDLEEAMRFHNRSFLAI